MHKKTKIFRDRLKNKKIGVKVEIKYKYLLALPWKFQTDKKG